MLRTYDDKGRVGDSWVALVIWCFLLDFSFKSFDPAKRAPRQVSLHTMHDFVTVHSVT